MDATLALDSADVNARRGPILLMIPAISNAAPQRGCQPPAVRHQRLAWARPAQQDWGRGNTICSRPITTCSSAMPVWPAKQMEEQRAEQQRQYAEQREAQRLRMEQARRVAEQRRNLQTYQQLVDKRPAIRSVCAAVWSRTLPISRCRRHHAALVAGANADPAHCAGRWQ